MEYKNHSYVGGEVSEKKILLFIILISIAIIFGGIILVGGNSPSAPSVAASSNVKVAVNRDSFNWGNIPINGGFAIKTFFIRNTGTETLKLFNIKTSCHCTKAHLTIDGKDSPDFGMSGISPYTGEVKPGKEAKLTVVFDPAFHGPQGTGPIERYISVETNSQENSKLTFTLTGVVVK